MTMVLTAFEAAAKPMKVMGVVNSIDAEAGSIDLDVAEDVLAERRKHWKARTNDYQAGALYRYAQNVGPAHLGAVTHPGAKAETHVYADI